MGFVLLVYAESRKVFSRGSGIAALIIALVVGILAAFGMWQVERMQGGLSVNGQAAANLMEFNAIAAAGLALQLRNFFVLPTLLLLAAGASVAGEQADQTMRDLMVRPVARPVILLAKLSALSLLALATLALTFVPSFGMGLGFWGGEVERVDLIIAGYGASFLSDLGLLLIGMLVSLFVRSVGGVVVTVVLLLMADRALWLLLKVLGMVGVEHVDTVQQLTLVNALGCWEGWKDGWEPARFFALGVLVVATSLFSVIRVSRMDVP